VLRPGGHLSPHQQLLRSPDDALPGPRQHQQRWLQQHGGKSWATGKVRQPCRIKAIKQAQQDGHAKPAAPQPKSSRQLCRCVKQCAWWCCGPKLSCSCCCMAQHGLCLSS
jgi:hypothetical protein